ncbi:MAG: ribosomal L7Ae/L30e/S12e/Gadd45 family protein [Oscillospiraceae bacterium]|nr:ribosomal L7Ae/L30e/S12e/Gadd45 family protein [Oscillospiraceae bacterium]
MSNGLGLLGLALRAGKLAAGYTAVSEAVHTKRARLICTAADASERVRESARHMPDRCNGLYTDTGFTQEQLGRALGLNACGIVAFLDPGFAWAFAKKLEEKDRERYGALVEALAHRKDRATKRQIKKKQRSRKPGKKPGGNQARGGRSND